MTTVATAVPHSRDGPSTSTDELPLKPRAPRVASVDVLRAFVMFTMLFVNDVAGVPGIPWWMKHYHPSTASGMTFVDLVFPAFLFLVGMSIPLSLQGRLSRGEPLWKIVGHIVTRGLALLLIGIFMVNMESIGTERMTGWRPGVWQFVTFMAVIAVFHSVPLKSRTAKGISTGLRLLGAVTLAYLATVYQRRGGRPDDVDHWTRMRPSWYGILGLIGWAYMTAAILYLPFRRSRGILLILTLGLLSLWVLDGWGWLNWSGGWISGERTGALAAISMAGVALATTFAGPIALSTARQRIGFAAGLSCAAAIGAILLHDGYGINKNAATPAWCLWAISITAALWIPFHLMLDLWRTQPRRVATIAYAGGNVLMAYILADVIAYLYEVTGWDFYYDLASTPNAGIVRSLVFAAVLLIFCAFLNRFRIRLKV